MKRISVLFSKELRKREVFVSQSKGYEKAMRFLHELINVAAFSKELPRFSMLFPLISNPKWWETHSAFINALDESERMAVYIALVKDLTLDGIELINIRVKIFRKQENPPFFSIVRSFIVSDGVAI